MLQEFIQVNQDDIIRRCRSKAATRSVSAAADAELGHGVPVFLHQLIDVLRVKDASTDEISSSASLHGRELLLQGHTVAQVVHGYGDVCQSITELALETN